jgi:hypothetical protein
MEKSDDNQPEETHQQSTKKHRHSAATVVIPDTAAVMPMGFQHPFTLHPATLDSCLHALFATISIDDPALPVSINEMRIDAQVPQEPGKQLHVLTGCHWKDARNISADLVVKGHVQDTRPVISISGLSLTSLARSNSDPSSHFPIILTVAA